MRRWLDPAWLLLPSELDRRIALTLHQAAAHPRVLQFLRICSRLGDGPLWAVTLLVLPLAGGMVGRRCATLLLAVVVVNLVIYWCLKRVTRRLRPFEQCPGIRACMRVPDHFSFPSGHTLHAVACALLLSAFYPALGLMLWPLAVLVAASRVVLGLHYPSDVLAGALIGAATASAALLPLWALQ